MSEVTDKSIKLRLRKSYYENYLRFAFNCPEGTIKINRDEDIGLYLFSRVRYSDVPVKQIPDDSISLLLPVHHLDRSGFVYYTADDMARINDYIEATANLDFRMMVQTGTIDLKMDRKTVISIFSDIVFGEDKYEMLKKDEYRKRKKLMIWLRSTAKHLGYKQVNNF